MSLSHSATLNDLAILDQYNKSNIILQRSNLFSHIDDFILDLTGREFREFPYYEIGNSNRDYIDYIDGTDMSSSLMRGADIHGRPCFIIKVRITRDSISRISTLCLFTRYTDSAMICQARETLPSDTIVFNISKTKTHDMIKELLYSGKYMCDATNKIWEII